MVIVKLIGGLGNQLFQYAAGRSLAHRHQTALKLDITGYKSYKLRAYSLSPFHIQEEFASPEEIDAVKRIPSTKTSRLLSIISEKFIPYYRRSIFCELYVRPFDKNIFKTSRDVYLDGYWQSEKYFWDIEAIIRQEFTLKSKTEPVNEITSQQIQRVESVSLHLRRGDYVSDPKISQVHGICSLDYYYTAVQELTKYIEQPVFFVFSDDPDWAQENLKLDYPMFYVTHNGAEKNYEDLHLMSLCKHQIIANSSFSWWGAWLCTNPEKIVIAPRKWFNSTEYDTRDLIPDRWIRT